MSKRLTDKDEKVRELTREDMRRMRLMTEVLPMSLQRAILQRGSQGLPR